MMRTYGDYLHSAKTIDELKNFLRRKIRSHKEFYHFTTLETLKAILLNRKWRLSSASRMNDLHEYNNKGYSPEWEKIFSTCFSFGDEDNMAMWAMYCIPWKQAVRITIDQKTMSLWLASLRLERELFMTNGCLLMNLAGVFDFYDIVYYYGYVNSSKSKLLWNRSQAPVFKTPEGIDISTSAEITGFIKNSAWFQEQESRLVFRTEANIGQEQIDVAVPDDVFENMQITFGPWFSGDKIATITHVLDSTGISSSLRENIINNTNVSDFKGKIKLRRHCNHCKCKFTREP